jgi:hypothetical protein
MGEAIRPFGRVDIGGDDRAFLLAGWFTPEREGGLSFRWATQQAALTLPLAFATDLDLQIRLRAFPRPGDSQTVTVDTGAGRFGPLPVGPTGRRWWLPPSAAWRAGPNQVVLTFSRVGASGQSRRRRHLRPVGGGRPSASRCTTEPAMVTTTLIRRRWSAACSPASGSAA